MNRFIFPLLAIVLISAAGCRKQDNALPCICKLTNIDDGVSDYEYDSHNRMIRRTVGGSSITYAYNAQGNLVTNVYGDSLHYDNKVNFNRTDPVLQFINRDYSVNNPIGASSYNAYGLPLEYPYSHGGSTIIIDYMGFFNPVFTYRCK